MWALRRDIFLDTQLTIKVPTLDACDSGRLTKSHTDARGVCARPTEEASCGARVITVFSAVRGVGGVSWVWLSAALCHKQGAEGKEKWQGKGKHIKIQHNTCTFSAAWMCGLALHEGNRNRSKLEKSWDDSTFLRGGGS